MSAIKMISNKSHYIIFLQYFPVMPCIWCMNAIIYANSSFGKSRKCFELLSRTERNKKKSKFSTVSIKDINKISSIIKK